jgi:hypothetical protein
MMSRQLTWYSSLTSEEETVTTRDVEPFVVCSDKVQFIDPPCRLDLLPMNEESFLPPRGKGPQGEKQNPNSGYKCPNPHSEIQSMKPLPQVTLEEVTRHNKGDTSQQKRRRLKPQSHSNKH